MGMNKHVIILIRHKLAYIAIYLKIFLRWLVCAGMVGVCCGFVGAAFAACVSRANELRQDEPEILFLLPAAGLLLVLFYHLLGMDQDRGTNLVILAVRSREHVPLRQLLAIFVGTVLTHLFGGSAGREGAALQIGGSIGSYIGTRRGLDEKDMHLITMCGMSGLFSALFGTPLTAAFFSIEVISVGIMHYSALLPCLLSSMIGYGISSMLGVRGEHYTILEAPGMNPVSVAQTALLGALCGVVSILFCVSMHMGSKWAQKYLKNRYLRVLAGSAVIILLTLLVGNQDYNGAGSAVIERAIEGEAVPYAFLLKILFTAVTLAVGFKGGEIVPTFFVWATLGCVAAPLLGLPASFGAAAAMVGMFCGVVNCPVSSILLSIELFGSEHLLLFSAAAAVSYMLSGNYSLYQSQKIVYSKLKAKYINVSAK